MVLGKVKQKLNLLSSLSRPNTVYLVLLFLNYFAYAVSSKNIYYTIRDLATIYHVPSDDIEHLFIPIYLGFLLGSAGNYLHRTLNRQLLLVVALLSLALTNTFLPHYGHLWALYAAKAVNGVASGLWECGNSIWLIEMVPEAFAWALQIDQWAYNLGALGTMVLVKPFILEGESLGGNVTLLDRRKSLAIPYLLNGFLQALVPCIFLALYFASPYVKPRSHHDQDHFEARKGSTFDSQTRNGSTFDSEARKTSFFDSEARKASTFDSESRKGSTFDYEARKTSTFDSQARKGSTFDAEARKTSIFDSEARKTSIFDSQARKGSTFDYEARKGSTFDSEARKGSTFDSEARKSSIFDSQARKASSALDLSPFPCTRPSRPKRASTRKYKMALCALSCVLHYSAEIAFLTNLTVIWDSLGLTETQSAQAYLIVHLTSCVGPLLVALLFTRLKPERLLPYQFTIEILAFICLYIKHDNSALIYLATGALGLTVSTIHPAILAFIEINLQLDERDISLYTAMSGVSMLMTPWAVEQVQSFSPHNWLFLYEASSISLSLLLFMISKWWIFKWRDLRLSCLANSKKIIHKHGDNGD